MKTKINSFRDLMVWTLGINIVSVVYELTKEFPKHERYGLSSQMQRAATSIPSNIAEGFCRFYRKEYIRHLLISLGSTAELETQLEIAHNLKYVGEDKKNNLLKDIKHEARMLTSLVSALNRRQRLSRTSKHLGRCSLTPDH